MRRLLHTFSTDERGATAIEYGLIAALCSIAAIVGMGSLGSSLDTLFTSIEPTITEATEGMSGNGS
jgi:pilus assembly protein Flp/PilA